MRYVLLAAFLAFCAGCASPEDVNPDEPIEVTAGDDQPIPGVPPGLDYRAFLAAQRESLRIAQLNDEYRNALYEVIRLGIDSRPVAERRAELNERLRIADRSLSDMSRIYNRLSAACRDLSIECRRRYNADDEYYGGEVTETQLILLRRQYRQIGDAFHGMGQQYDGLSDITMDLLREISGMRRGLDPTYR